MNAPSRTDLDAEIRRWMGGVLVMMGPKISTDAYNALVAARDNLNDILDTHQPAAAVAAHKE